MGTRRTEGVVRHGAVYFHKTTYAQLCCQQNPQQEHKMPNPCTSKLKCDRLLETSSADWSRAKVQRPRWKYAPVYLPVGPLSQKQISANDEPVCGSRPQKRKTERRSQVDAVLVRRLLRACVADSALQEMELNVEEVNRSQRHHCSCCEVSFLLIAYIIRI